ncbi:hypothetical protein V6N13_111830 [Hibiscus sabdariffa]
MESPGSSRNPTSCSTVVPSGRPPDGIAPVIDNLVCDSGTVNLVVDDEMTENEFRNGESTEISLPPKAAMAVDEKHGSNTSVGVSSQSDQLGGSKNSLKPSFRDMLTGKGGGTQHSNFISELDVELGDSDVIIGKEACGQSQVVEVAVPSQRQVSNSSSEPYGPWMQVVNRRGRGSVAPRKTLQEEVNRRSVASASGSRFDALYVLGEGEVNVAASGTGHPMAKGGGAVSPALADVGGQMAMELKAHSSPTRRVRAISSSVPLGGITKTTFPKTSMVVRVGEIIPQQSEVIGELANTDKEVGAILEVSETDSMVPVDHVEDELVGAIQEVHENDSMVSIDQVEDVLVRGRSIASKEKVIYAPSSLSLDKHTALRVVDRVDRGALKETNGRPMQGPIRVSTPKSSNRNFSLSKGLSRKGAKLKKNDGNEMEQPTLQTWAVNFSNSLNKIVPTAENSLSTHDSTTKVQWRANRAFEGVSDTNL